MTDTIGSYEVKWLRDHNKPFYPKVHAGAVAMPDGLTVEQHLINCEGFVQAALSGNDYVLSSNMKFVEGAKVTVKFIDASITEPPYILLTDGKRYPILKQNGEPAVIGENMYLSLVCGTDSFIGLVEGGDYGTATATDVLETATFGTEIGVAQGAIPVIEGVGTDSDKYDAKQMVYGQHDADGKNYVYLGMDPNAYYKGINWIRYEEPNLDPSNIKDGVSIFGVVGNSNIQDTTDGTVTASDMLPGKIAYAGGERIVGAMPTKGAATYTPSSAAQTINAGQYLTGAQTIAGDSDFIASNIKHNVEIFGKTGTFTSDGTLSASKMLSGTIGYSQGTKYTGSIPSISSNTYRPTTSNQYIYSGNYLSGNQTIQGDSNLKSSNIKSGVSIFGVSGSYSGSGGSSGGGATWTGSQSIYLFGDDTKTISLPSGQYTLSGDGNYRGYGPSSIKITGTGITITQTATSGTSSWCVTKFTVNNNPTSVTFTATCSSSKHASGTLDKVA